MSCSFVLPSEGIKWLHISALSVLIFILLFSPCSAYVCASGANIDAESDEIAKARCDAFVQYKQRGEIKVDPAIETRIPPQPGNREIRSIALVVAVWKYPNFPEDTDKNIDAIKSDVPQIVSFLKSQNFDEIIVLENANASPENIRYFLNTYIYNIARIYKRRSRVLFAFDGHGSPGDTTHGSGYMALTGSRNELDRAEENVYALKYLESDLEHIAAYAYHTVALLGSCYSGGVFPIDPNSGRNFTFSKAPGAHAITATDVVHRAWTDPSGKGTVFFIEFLKAVGVVAANYSVNEASTVVTPDGRADYATDSIVRLGAAFDKANEYLEDMKNPSTGELYPQLEIGSIAPDQDLRGAFFFLGPRPSVPLLSTGSAVIGHPEIQVFRSADTYSIRGVDISDFSGDINFQALKNASITFVYQKATQGAISQSKNYAKNMAASKKIGLLRGAYHFFETCVSADKQFQNLINVAKSEDLDLPIAVDIEWEVHRSMDKFVSTGCYDATSNKEILRFLAMVEQHFGKRPIIYTAGAFTKEHPSLVPLFEEFPLWVADFGKARIASGKPMLPGKTPWTIWQTGDNARIPGINVGVDLNVFFGTNKDFSLFAEGKVDAALAAALPTPK